MPKRSARNRRSNNRTAAWLMLTLGVAIVGSVLGYVKWAPADRIPESQRRLGPGQIAAQAPPKHSEGSVSVPVPRYVDGDLQFEHKTVKAPQGADRYALAVNEFLKEAGITPAGAKVVGTRLERGALILDLSKEFDQTYGTEDEQTLVNGVLTALGQFAEIDTVEFDVGGKPLETLGNIDLTMPLPVIRRS